MTRVRRVLIWSPSSFGLTMHALPELWPRREVHLGTSPVGLLPGRRLLLRRLLVEDPRRELIKVFYRWSNGGSPAAVASRWMAAATLSSSRMLKKILTPFVS